jgi:hypothetical protein
MHKKGLNTLTILWMICTIYTFNRVAGNEMFHRFPVISDLQKQRKTQKKTRNMAFWGLPQVYNHTKSIDLWVGRIGKQGMSEYYAL